jgi:hypothetical protein
MHAFRLSLGIAALCASAAIAAEPTLHYDVPAGWRVEQPTSSMRLAQFTLPRGDGDAEDALAVIYFFGQGQGGSVEANLARWASQMGQAGGRPGTVQDGKTTTLTTNGHTVSLLDIAGTYTDTMGGGGPKAGYRMKAAVVETPGGPYFIKLTGPEKTILKWDASFQAFLKSMSYK